MTAPVADPAHRRCGVMTTFCGSGGMSEEAPEDVSGCAAAAASTSATVLSAGFIMGASKRVRRQAEAPGGEAGASGSDAHPAQAACTCGAAAEG